MEFIEGMEKLDQALSDLSLTPNQKKQMTKAGALVYKESLRNNMNNSLHKGKYSRETKVKLEDDIGISYKAEDGATYVGFKSTTGHSGYIARILNDGYAAHGGKGAKAHKTRIISGLHFQEKSLVESKSMILAAEAKKYRELTGD
ncbi:HK97 gp10 family phage protein [Companilactobacillus jidongensis]|uniref:HK97 gp10 family phage protein n=1 Tax=Companilactobacillus jidongensis TaxID=2486006 RepID=UPI000F76A96B|nr:HK97 gp10 family phage protein [Companilactobacillus jidongensis]